MVSRAVEKETQTYHVVLDYLYKFNGFRSIPVSQEIHLQSFPSLVAYSLLSPLFPICTFTFGSFESTDEHIELEDVVDILRSKETQG